MNRFSNGFLKGALGVILSFCTLSTSPYTERLEVSPTNTAPSIAEMPKKTPFFTHSTIGSTGAYPGLSDINLEEASAEISSNVSAKNASEDGLQYSYMELCGDSEIVVNVKEITGKGFAGISFRESTAPGAKTIGLFKQSFNNVVYRTARLRENDPLNYAKQLRPIDDWLKLRRKGRKIFCSTSDDGYNWTPLYDVHFRSGKCLLAGIAVESENTETTTVASFDQLQISEKGKSLLRPNQKQTKLAGRNTASPGIGEFYATAADEEIAALNIEVEKESEARINIFTRAGKQIQHKVLQLHEGTNTLLVDVKDWPKGSYIAYISAENQTIPKFLNILN